MIKLQQTIPMIPDYRLELVGKGLLNVIYKNAWITTVQYQNIKNMLSTDILKGIKALSDILTNLSLNINKTRKDN